MASFFRSRTGKVLSVLAVLFLLYCLAGFFLVPRIVRSQLVENVQKTLELTPSVGEITFNPLQLQLEVHDFALPGADGTKLIGFERFAVALDIASLWHGAAVLRDVEIDAPAVNAIIDHAGRINLSQLQPKTPSAPQDPNKPLPRIQIHLFKVNRGTVAFRDESRSPQFATELVPINFDLRDFTTGSDGGQFDFSAATQSAERLEWHGHISVAPLESDGDIAVTGLKAKTIWEYIESQVNFVVSGGQIDLAAHYRASLQGATDVHVELKQFDVAGLGVRPKGGDKDWISLPELKVGPAVLDLAHRDLTVEQVLLKGLQVTAMMGPDKQLNLLQLAAAPASGGARAPATPAKVAAASPAKRPAPAAAAPTPAAGWHVALKELSLQAAAIGFEDHSVSPAATFRLQPLDVGVRGASLDLTQPVQVTLATGINGSGHLDVAGAVTPAPLNADMTVQLNGFDLTALQPYIGQVTGMILQSGVLGADLKVRYGGAQPQAMVAGSVTVTKLHTVDRELHDDFVNWQSLELKGLNYRQQPARLELDRVTVRKLYSRAIVEADETLNVQRVLSPRAALAKAQPPGTAPAKAPAKVAEKGGAKPAPAPVAAAAPAMYIAVHLIDIGDSTMNFSDLSINPNFNAGIKKFGGTITGLSSKPGTRAKVDLKGEVDEFSPVTISGELNPLSPAMYADLSMSFHNIELSIMNPYSGKFAGYNIAKGKLTADMHYKVEGRKLDAQHHIVIDQLEFGDSTGSKDAVSLPIKLAVSLLKDRNGVIDLPLPINGSLDDPQFRIAPIVWKVLVNLLEKAVTAPFALLGRLFSAGPDLQFIDFVPGSADVDAQASEHMKTIAKALGERPQLKLDLPIAYVASVDGPALASAKLAAALQAAQKTKPGSPALSFEQLDPGKQLALLHSVYVAAAGGEPKYPDAIAAIKSRGDADAARRDFLQKELLARSGATPDELLKLGQRRAQALQSVLLTDSGLDPARVFLVESDKAKLEGDHVRLEMSLH